MDREVDFLVSRDGEPWFLADCKSADTSIAPAMKSLQKEIGVPHAVQVVFDLPYAETDVFGWGRPVAVSARTFLSQLPCWPPAISLLYPCRGNK